MANDACVNGERRVCKCRTTRATMASLMCLGVTINVLRWPFSRVESPAFVQKASERGLLVEFLRRGKMRQIEEKASERGASVRVSRLERGLFLMLFVTFRGWKS